MRRFSLIIVQVTRFTLDHVRWIGLLRWLVRCLLRCEWFEDADGPLSGRALGQHDLALRRAVE